MTANVAFVNELRPEQWTYLLGHMEAGKPLPVLTSPDLEEACRLAKEAGTHDYTMDGRHITITRRKLPATPVAFTDKPVIERAVDSAEANVLAITNTEATACKCRAAAHREKDRAELLPTLNANLAHSMLAVAMAKPRPVAETMEKISDLLETLTLNDRRHFLNCLYDEQPESFAVVADRIGGGR